MDAPVSIEQTTKSRGRTSEWLEGLDANVRKHFYCEKRELPDIRPDVQHHAETQTAQNRCVLDGSADAMANSAAKDRIPGQPRKFDHLLQALVHASTEYARATFSPDVAVTCRVSRHSRVRSCCNPAISATGK